MLLLEDTPLLLFVYISPRRLKLYLFLFHYTNVGNNYNY